LRKGESSRAADAVSLESVRSVVAVDFDRLAHTRVAVANGIRAELTERRPAFLAQLSARASDFSADGDSVVDDELEDKRWEIVDALIEVGLEAIKRGQPWEGPLPAEVGTQARRAAAAGLSVTSVLDRCMAGFALVRDLFCMQLEARDLSRDDEHALQRQMSQLMDKLRRRVLRELEQAHEHECRQTMRTMAQRRAEMARKLLAGATPTSQEVLDLGGYDLDGWHIAVVATGADAKKIVALLANQLGCEALPVFQGAQGTSVILGAQRKVAFEDIERIAYGQAKDMDALLALGEVARGLKGMRITHRGAEAATLVARYDPRKITRYADIEPEAAALLDDALGEALIERYLSPLDEMGISGHEARRTIQAFLDSGGSYSKAARSLPVDRSTMYERIKKIREQLGFDLWEQRSKIERALRVEELRRYRDSDHKCQVGAGSLLTTQNPT
jgi:PucR-like helix-turn-helix protein